ncbi:hypothetical protein [Brachybacterium sp. GPGPB12]|uniref:alpha-L-rhamnosidase-related protein n=1 Tax=Brachybacterium sp. GPGPB12 TaxID=3023517 RepID=UPI00313442C9
MLAWEEYLATGDDALLRSDLDLWRRATYDRDLRADGLVHREVLPASSWDAVLVDWPVSCRDDVEITPANTVLNAFQAAAHDALARICTVLGRAREAEHHASLAALTREGIENHLVREDGTYRDGLDTDHAARHSSAIPAALGLAPARWHRELGRHSPQAGCG